MSEPLGEATVRIVPDTSTFAAELKAGVAGSVAASEAALASARKGSAQAKEAGVKVRNLASATQALTTAQNANRRVVEAAAKALVVASGSTDTLTAAQERHQRATRLVTAADKAVERSKAAVAAAEKAYVGAIAAGIDPVTTSIQQSQRAAAAALHLAEANQAAAVAHEKKAKSAISDARAEEAAAAATSSSIKGTVGAAAATAAARTRGIVPADVAGTTKAGAEAAKAGKATRELTKAQNLQTVAASKLDLANRAVANATSGLAAAQIKASRASSAVRAAEASVASARKFGTAEMIKHAEATLRDAQALEKNTVATFRNLKVHQQHASQLAFARRGILASSLSFVGLRGATLAANSAFIAGAAALLVFAKSLGVATRFETQLNVFRVTTGATADEMERMSAVAVQLGADLTLPGVSAGDAAEAMTELAKAGLSVEDAVEGARGVLQLATAAAITNAEATQLAASALNAFGLRGDQAVRVADILANAANSAQGSIADMGLALQQAAAVGRQVGLSLEDTTVFITALTRAGIRGSDAGTSLRTALLRLINPTKKIKAVFDELGVVLRDQEGNLRPDFFVNLGIALQGLSKEQRDAKIAILGGADAIRSLSILSRQSIDDLIGLRQQIRQQGTAADVAAARTAGLAGAGKALQNTLENIGLAIGQSVTPGLTSFVHGLTTTTAAIAANQNVTGTLKQTLGAIGDAFQVLGAAISVSLPVFNAFAGVALRATQAIGVTEILSAVAAYKLLRAAVRADFFTAVGARALYAADAIRTFATRVTIAGSVTAGARVGAASLATAMTGLISPTTAVTLGVAALAAGLVFLITRESAAEKATRNLKNATDELQSSLAAVAATTESYAQAISSVETNRLAVSSAKLAAESAKIALSNSAAAKGSLERQQLENGLKVALDNVRLAEERLATSIQDKADLQAKLAVETRNASDARLKEAGAIEKVIEAQVREAAQRSGTAAGRMAARGDAAALARIEAQSIEEITEALRNQADEEAKDSSKQAQSIAKRIRALAELSEQIKRAPSRKEIEIILTAPSVRAGLERIVKESGIAGEDSAKAYVQNLIDGIEQGIPKLVPLGPEIFAQLNEQWSSAGTKDATDYMKAFADAAKAHQERVADAIAAAVAAAQRKVAAVENRALDLRIAGAFTPQAELANLQQKRRAQELAVSAVKRQRDIGKATDDDVKQAKEDLADTVDAIKSLEKSIADDAKRAQDEITKARDDADKAVIDALTGGKRRTKIETLLERAEATEGRRDDIKFARILIKILARQKERAKTLIKNLETRRDFIRATNALIRSLNSQIKDDQEAQKDLLKQQRADRQAEILARIDADIEFAQIKENAQKEIRARQARIRFLQARQRELIREKGQRAKNTAAYKELRNQIAQEKQAIKDLRKEQEGFNDEARKLIFEFLQQQQSFAANLLSNLFPAELNLTSPGGGTGPGGTGRGNIGAAAAAAAEQRRRTMGILRAEEMDAGVRPPASQLGPEARFAEARDKGPTAGQSNVQIVLLREIRDILLGNYKGSGKNHPAAAQQRRASRGVMEAM